MALKRIESIAIIRGFAVLQMICWQIYDFCATSDIYARTDPFFFEPFNHPVNGIGLILFAFISGTALYMSIKKRMHQGRLKVIKHSLLRYGTYILVSLFFTSFVFGFKTFFIWGEAIQGIGSAAIIATILIIFIPSKWFYLGFGILLTLTQPLIRLSLASVSGTYPMNPTMSANALVSIFLNATVRGYFSLTHVLPVMFFGIFLSIMIKELNNKKKVMISSSIVAAIFATIGLFLHFMHDKIDVYNWTPAYQFFYTGLSLFLFIMSEIILRKRKKTRITNFLAVFGRAPIIAYLGHFLFIKKPLELLGIENTFDIGISLVFSILLVFIIYKASVLWLAKKSYHHKTK